MPVRAAAPQHSLLWGERGERWTPDSRLPDFSYAGYRRGESPLPALKPQASVRDLGAAPFAQQRNRVRCDSGLATLNGPTAASVQEIALLRVQHPDFRLPIFTHARPEQDFPHFFDELARGRVEDERRF